MSLGVSSSHIHDCKIMLFVAKILILPIFTPKNEQVHARKRKKFV